jgi:hypothetical protein
VIDIIAIAAHTTDKRCHGTNKRNGKQCWCRITRNESTLFEFNRAKGFVYCVSCAHLVGMHPGPFIHDSQPHVPPSVQSAAAPVPVPAQAAAATVPIGRRDDSVDAANALATLDTAADSNSAGAVDFTQIVLLRPLSGADRERFASNSTRNAEHSVHRTRKVKTAFNVPMYDVSKEKVLQEFVMYLKTAGEKEPDTVCLVHVC